MAAYDLIRDLGPLARHFASPDYDRAIDRLRSELDFTVHFFGPEDEHNGWIVPPHYEVLSATISRNGNVLYDGAAHPLGVVSYSTAFTGSVSGSELRRHCWFDLRDPSAIPYHFRYSYRPWDRDWGFCIPKDLYDKLDDAEYDVEIRIKEGPAELKVLDYVVPGKSSKEYVVCAHLDHPGMANDDLAGCAVGVELFKQLRHMKLNFTYRLLLVQEIVGSQFYLNRFGSKNIISGLFLEMLGVDVPLRMQHSFGADTMFERNLLSFIPTQNGNRKGVDFRSLVGNDEIVFESHGVPMCSLVRWPYPQYHSNKDSSDIILDSRLREAEQVVLNSIRALDREIYIERMFNGLFCLSNPSYDLYIDAGQPAFGQSEVQPLRELMEYLSLMPKEVYLSDLCERFSLDSKHVLAYLHRWENAGLLKIFGHDEGGSVMGEGVNTI